MQLIPSPLSSNILNSSGTQSDEILAQQPCCTAFYGPLMAYFCDGSDLNNSNIIIEDDARIQSTMKTIWLIQNVFDNSRGGHVKHANQVISKKYKYNFLANISP